MEIYVKKLIKQFAEANGIKNIDMNSEKFIDEFVEWIRVRKEIGKQYICLLDCLDLNFSESTCAEVGKGKFDSVVAPFETTMITQVPKEFVGVNSSRIITGNLQVWNGQPMLLKYSESLNLIEPIPIDTITTYMTQNPYTRSNLLRWEDIHNSGNNIIVGIYGDIHDKDYDEKIKEMVSLREKIDDRYREDYVVDGDNYYYAIGTKKLVKKLCNLKTGTK